MAEIMVDNVLKSSQQQTLLLKTEKLNYGKHKPTVDDKIKEYFSGAKKVEKVNNESLKKYEFQADKGKVLGYLVEIMENKKVVSTHIQTKDGYYEDEDGDKKIDSLTRCPDATIKKEKKISEKDLWKNVVPM